MTKEDVIRIRDILKKANPKKGITIVGDNMLEFDEKLDWIKWDDNNAILYSIRTASLDYMSQKDRPMEMTGTSYENIQYLKCSLSPDDFRISAKAIGYTDLEIDAMLSKYNLKERDFLIGPGINNNEKGM